ncbi:MAG: hypothetical protein ACREQ5_02655 [Candidatus Dormibacteria bacterium]
MQLNIRKGIRVIKATKNEVKALEAGADVLATYLGTHPKDAEEVEKALQTTRRVARLLSGEDQDKSVEGATP